MNTGLLVTWADDEDGMEDTTTIVAPAGILTGTPPRLDATVAPTDVTAPEESFRCL